MRSQVASDDARTAKRMFVFLGLPGALLAAILTSYAGGVLASALRREQAILRIRGANRRHLLRMHALRTLALAAVGSVLGVALGLVSAAVVLSADALASASPVSLLVVGFARCRRRISRHWRRAVRGGAARHQPPDQRGASPAGVAERRCGGFSGSTF